MILLPILVVAISSPLLISPINESTSESSTITWETQTNAVQYKVIIDDEETVSSPYLKGPYYTTSNKYSPKLDPGRYFWKVAAKDSGDSWSEWSDIWSFTLSEKSDPTPNPSNPSSPSPSQSKSSFTFTNHLSQIDSTQNFIISVNLNLPNNPNTVFYLKGAFKSIEGSNYFGQTKVGSSWIKNGGGFSNQQKITTDSQGSWSGSLELMPDQEDSGFTGSGDYLLKVARYSSSGSGPTWSNEETLHIEETNISEPQPSITPIRPSTSVPSVKGITKKLGLPKIATTSSFSAQISATPSAQVSNPGSTPKSVITKATKSFSFIPIALGILVLIISGVIFYFRLKKD